MTDPNTIKRIVEEIIKDLTDRSGFQQAWEECDVSVQHEIRESWTAIVHKGLTG